MPGEKSLERLRGACRERIKAARSDEAFPRAMLDRGLAAFDLPELGRAFPERDPPDSDRHLRTALDAGLGSGDNVIAALSEVWRHLRWVTNPNYEGRPEMSRYLCNAAYAEIVGTRGLVERDDISTGFFYIGPDVLYPAHDHPSPEAYWVLSGTADWWHDGIDWTPRPAGSRIFHPPFVPHAMRTAGDPLLCFFIWTGDVGEYARVTERPASEHTTRTEPAS